MRIVRFILVVVITSVFATLSHCDGLFFEEEALNGSSSIPNQRAIIAHKNGKEALLVESTLRGNKGNYAWIIPVPSVPTKIEPNYSCVFEDLNFVLQPKVNDWHRYPNRTLWLYAIVLTALSITTAYLVKTRKHIYIYYIGNIALLTLIAMLSITVLNDLFGQHRFIAGEATTEEDMATVLKSGEVGNYTYVVLGAKSSNDVLTWLHSHQYKVPRSSEAALNQYIRKGWKFFTAKLKKTKQDQTHPVFLEFATKECVYPMALTATGKPPLDLDLYIIGDSVARVPHTCFIASTNVYVEKYVDPETNKPRTDISPTEEEQFIPYLTEGRIITRVHGHYESKIPKADFDIRFTNSKATYRAVLTTPDSALANATGTNLLLYSLTILSSSLILFRFRRPVLTVSLAALIAACVFTAKATVDYRITPKTFYNSIGK